MCISSIHGMQRYLIKNSGFSGRTINNVILALGYQPLHGTEKDFKELSKFFVECAKNGAQKSFIGFKYSTELFQFFQQNRADIVVRLGQDAIIKCVNICNLVQNFALSRNSRIPLEEKINIALWEKTDTFPELEDVYTVLVWYTLEEISKTWYRHLEENPDFWVKIAA